MPADYFEGALVSNFLEHLPTPDAIFDFLSRMHDWMAPGGRIAILGPNYRYCSATYWDFADHWLALTHLAIEEHLYAAGFQPVETHAQFLPFSFTGRLPASAGLTRLYLRTPRGLARARQAVPGDRREVARRWAAGRASPARSPSRAPRCQRPRRGERRQGREVEALDRGRLGAAGEHGGDQLVLTGPALLGGPSAELRPVEPRQTSPERKSSSEAYTPGELVSKRSLPGPVGASAA